MLSWPVFTITTHKDFIDNVQLKSRQTDRQNSSERRLLARIDTQCWPMLESIGDLGSVETTSESLFTLVNS